MRSPLLSAGNVVTNGLQARELQFADLAVRMSDLAATTSTLLRVVADHGWQERLGPLESQARSFIEAANELQAGAPERSPYRSLVPFKVWQAGAGQMPEVGSVTERLPELLASIRVAGAESEVLRRQAKVLRELSLTFQKLANQALQSSASTLPDSGAIK